MATVKEDEKKEPETAATDAPTEESSLATSSLATTSKDDAKANVGDSANEDDEERDEPEGAVAAPMQLGTRRWVYAAYFAGAIAIAFLASKALGAGWYRLNQWKPASVPEPQDLPVLAASGLIGVLAAFYYWRRGRTRKLAEEVATELSKVTWPRWPEVRNSTFITIVTTLVATVFFALMDRFWGFVTNLVYGT